MNKLTKQRGFVAALAAIAVTTLVAGCSTGSAAGGGADREPGVIKIGLLTDFTGGSGLFGEPTQLAAELAVAQINDAGGVNGNPVELVVGDEGSDPSTGVSVTQRFIEQDNIVALFGQHNSATRDAVQPVAAADDIPYFYNAVNEGKACAANLFITGEVPSQQLSQSIPWVQNETGKKTWFLLGNDYSWPQQSFVDARKFIEANGGTVVGEEFVPMGTTDFQSIISKVRASGADVMIPALVGADAISFEKQAFDAGLGNEQVQRLGILYEDNTRAAMGAEVAAGMYNAVGYDQAVETDANAAFLEAYSAMHGAEAPVQTTLSVQTFVAIHAWANAANAAGSTDLDAVTGELIGSSVDAPAGLVTYEDNHFVAQPIYITENLADGSAQIATVFEPISAAETCNP